jgi:hypothetical protein
MPNVASQMMTYNLEDESVTELHYLTRVRFTVAQKGVSIFTITPKGTDVQCKQLPKYSPFDI